MKPIAELLIETQAVLRAGNWGAHAAATEAFHLIISVYGEPCDGTSDFHYADKANDYTAPPGEGAERPGDICCDCLWPRGHHGVKL